MHEQDDLKIYIYLSLMFIAWISISSSSILVLLSGANALQAAFWRLTFSLPLIMALMFMSQGKIVFRVTAKKVVSGIFLGMHFIFWMKSLFLIPVALSTAIVVLYPPISLIIEYSLLGERPRKREVFGMIVAFFGILLVLRPSIPASSNAFLGSLYALLGAFFIAGYFLLGRRIRRSGEGVFAYTLPTYSTAAITVLIPGLVTKGFLSLYPIRTWVYLLLLALIPMLGGHTVMNYVVKHYKASKVTSVALGEPIGASILAHIFLRQPITPQIIIGVIIVFIGLSSVMARKVG